MTGFTVGLNGMGHRCKQLLGSCASEGETDPRRITGVCRSLSLLISSTTQSTEGSLTCVGNGAQQALSLMLLSWGEGVIPSMHMDLRGL